MRERMIFNHVSYFLKSLSFNSLASGVWFSVWLSAGMGLLEIACAILI